MMTISLSYPFDLCMAPHVHFVIFGLLFVRIVFSLWSSSRTMDGLPFRCALPSPIAWGMGKLPLAHTFLAA